MVMEHLLMGPQNSQQFIKYFISNKFPIQKCKITSELLTLIVDTLKNENELHHLNRINLTTLFDARLTYAQIDKICELMIKFNIREVMCWRMRETVYWIEVYVPNKLKFVERFTILERNLKRFTPSLKYFTKCSSIGSSAGMNCCIQELNGLTFQKKEDVDRFCQNQALCDSLRCLTVYIPQSISIFDCTLRKILKHCKKNLNELNILIAYCIEPVHLDLNFDEELIKSCTECLNLKILRIDSMYTHSQHKFLTTSSSGGGGKKSSASAQLRFIPELPEKISKNIFPNLTELHIHTRNSSQDPLLHAYSGKLALQCLIPSHPLEKMDITNEFFNITFPKCRDISLSGDFIGIADKIPNFTQVHSLKLVSIVDRPDRYISRFHRYSNLKSLTLHKVNVQYGEHLTVSKIKFCTFIEELTIVNSFLHHNFLQQIVSSSPDLKSLKLDQIDTYKDVTSIELDVSNRYSKMVNLCVLDCCGTFSEILVLILNENPKLINNIHLRACCDGDSLTHEFLEKLFSIESKPEHVMIEGIEFTDLLIEKYLNWRVFPSTTTIDFSFHGKSITSKYLLNPKNCDTIHKIATLSLPCCEIEDDDFCEILEYLNRDRVEKIEINLGKSGPSVETFDQLKSFKSLQVLDIRGMIENMDANNQLQLVESIKEFIIEMPNLIECTLDCWNVSNNNMLLLLEIDSLKSTIRLRGRSPPKLRNNTIDNTPTQTACLIC